MKKFVALLLFTVLVLVRPAVAQYDCSPPSEPSCISDLSFNRDDCVFESCRSDVESYRLRMVDYLSCLEREHSEGLENLKHIVDRFNACARNQYACY